jgi:hypothetical protein
MIMIAAADPQCNPLVNISWPQATVYIVIAICVAAVLIAFAKFS